MRRKSSGTKQSSHSHWCLKKFLFYFKEGYSDPQFLAWEREYKLNAHKSFQKQLNKKQYNKLLIEKEYKSIAEIAVRIESRTNLLFSFEKMALRDAIKSKDGAKIFSIGLFNYVYGKGTLENRFEKFCESVSLLPRKQTRVLTWPLVTVFGFIADPLEHIFLKPRVTKEAARKYQFDFIYTSKPNWVTYKSLLAFAEQIRLDTRKYKPKDYIDLQSFIWVMGSKEYPD
jgi:hypothetical protein